MLLSTKVIYVRASFIAGGLSMFIGSALLFVISLTSDHPSNHKVIQAAYLKSKMAEEEMLFDEMNISHSEDSLLSETDSNANSLLHTNEGGRSPSVHWSDEDASLTTPTPDDKGKQHFPLDDDNLDSPIQSYCQNRSTPLTGRKQDSTNSNRGPPPKYIHIKSDMISMESLITPEESKQKESGPSVVQADMLVHAHSTVAPAKSTYV